MTNDSTALHQPGAARELNRTLYTPGPDVSLRLHYCGSESCTAGHSFGPAVRAHYLVHFIQQGKGTYLRGNESYELNAGDAFLILPGETTRYTADETNPWTYTWVAFDGENAESLLQSCGLNTGNVIYHASDKKQAERLSRHASLFETSFYDSSLNPLEILGYFYLLFSCMYQEQSTLPLLSVSNQNKSLSDEALLSGQKLYFAQATEYLKHNFSYPVKTEQLALQIGVSRSYLYKTFINCCGKSIQEYLMDLRMEEAKKLLTNTSRSITEIGYSCGFTDSPSFCRHFKKSVGCTPLQFRENNSAAVTGTVIFP